MKLMFQGRGCYSEYRKEAISDSTSVEERIPEVLSETVGDMLMEPMERSCDAQMRQARDFISICHTAAPPATDGELSGSH